MSSSHREQGAQSPRLKTLSDKSCEVSDRRPVKHGAFTDMILVTQSVRDSDQDSASTGSTSQSKERLYKEKLLAYQAAQQRQAQLVQNLQTKVLQYKHRCEELEDQVLKKTSDSAKMRLSLLANLDSSERQQQKDQSLHRATLDKLEDKQKKCANLSQVNAMVREQLDQAGTDINGLTESLWKAHEDIELSDTTLCRERETCASRLICEQARVRALWRQTASLRSSFTQLRTSTHRTLSDTRRECVTACQQLHVACMNLQTRETRESTFSVIEGSAPERELKEKLKEALEQQAHWEAEKIELNSRIINLTDTTQYLRSQNAVKDADLSNMQISLERMELKGIKDRGEMETLHTEIEAFQKILLRVHQLVGSEGESCGIEKAPSPPYGHSSLKTSIILAVQNALSKHRDQLQELRASLDAALKQVDTLHSGLQEKDADRKKLEQMIYQVTRENQEAKKAQEESLRYGNGYRYSLEQISSEKECLEKLLSSRQQEVDSQHAEQEVLRNSLLELQRQRDLLKQEKKDLEMQLTHQRTEAQRGEKSLQEIEMKHSDLHQELVTVKETLNQTTLQKEVLEDDKASLALALMKMESERTAQECTITTLQNQESSLKDSLAKMAALSEGLAKDKVELSQILLQTEGQKMELGKRRREADVMRVAAREEVVRAQNDMMNLLAEKQALESSHSHLKDFCQKLEEEKSLLLWEKNQALEKHSQVTRQMQSVTEELCACHKELETQTTATHRAAHDREELAKDKASLDVKLNSADRKTSGLTQALLALRLDKESVEMRLFESQELVSSLRVKLTRLDAEKRALLLANEALTRDVAQVRSDNKQQSEQAALEQSKLEEKLAHIEKNTVLTLKNREQIHREQRDAERQQKEQQHAELTLQWEQAKEQLRRQCEEQCMHSQRELQQLHEELTRLQEDHRQKLLQAESDKQQALSLMEAEKEALRDRLEVSRQDLATANKKMKLLQREALIKQEQDKNAMTVLQSELQNLRTQFEKSLNTHETTRKSLTEQITGLNQQAEHVQLELGGLRQQLQVAEDRLIDSKRELTDTHRELQGCVQERDKQRKEVQDLRRVLGDQTREKEAIQSSNHELRAIIKKTESDNNSLRRAVEEKEQKVSVLEECKSSMYHEATNLRGIMRELEKSHLQARRELQESQRQVKVLVGESSRHKQELQELQARVCQEEQREEEARHDAFNLKQRLLQCGAGREVALNEVANLQSRVLELTTETHQKQEQLDEKEAFLHQSDQTAMEKIAFQEEKLEKTICQVKELSLQIELSENKAQTLQEQLGLRVTKCRRLESNLLQMYSALRHTVDIKPTRYSDKARSQRRPLRGHIHMDEDEELNLELVNAALRQFLQEYRDTQRERDESKDQVVALSQHVTQLKGSHDKSASQQLKLERSLKQSEEGKQKVEKQLQKLQASLSLLEEKSRHTEREKRNLEDDVAQLRISLRAAQTKACALQAEQHESQLREKLQNVLNSLDDNRANAGCLQKQITQLQKALAVSEQDRKLLQERLDKTRGALSESKRLNHTVKEQTQILQRGHEDSQLNISDLEKQNRTLKENLKRQQNAELQTSQQQQRAHEELQEKVVHLQSDLQQLQSEREEMEKVLTQLGRDKGALKKTLEKVELQRLRNDKEATSEAGLREQLEHTVGSLQQTLAKKQEVVDTLQAQFSLLEQSHAKRLLEVRARYHQELDLERERLRDCQLQAEQVAESRERAHRHRVKCLEAQVLTLKEQLDEEVKRQQANLNPTL